MELVAVHLELLSQLLLLVTRRGKISCGHWIPLFLLL